MSVDTMLRKDKEGKLFRRPELSKHAATQFESMGELKKALKPGDIILTRAVVPKLWSRAVSARQGSEFGHAALFAGGNKVIDTRVEEQGVHEITLEAMQSKGRDLRILRPKASASERKKAIEIARSYIGTPYSWKAALRTLLPAAKNVKDEALQTKRDAVICSQLITRAYPDLQVAAGKHRDHVLPVDFDKSPTTHRVGELRMTQEKVADAGISRMGAAGELLGLGTLAAPQADKMWAKHKARKAGALDQHGEISERNLDKFRVIKSKHDNALDVAGLGVLAAPYIKPLMKRAMVDELRELNALTAGQLDKLAAITDQEATGALTRLEKLKRDKPSAGQLGRGALVGATLGPVASLASRAIAGKSTQPMGVYRGVRDLAATATQGAFAGGLVPVVRHTADQRAEKGTLKKYLKEHGV